MRALYTSDRKKGNELLLLFTVWMVVWAAEASVDADHVDNHPLARLSLERAADWRPATTVLQSSHLPARTVTEWRTARPSKTIQLMPAALWWLINTELLSMYKEIRQNEKCTNFT